MKTKSEIRLVCVGCLFDVAEPTTNKIRGPHTQSREPITAVWNWSPGVQWSIMSLVVVGRGLKLRAFVHYHTHEGSKLNIYAIIARPSVWDILFFSHYKPLTEADSADCPTTAPVLSVFAVSSPVCWNPLHKLQDYLKSSELAFNFLEQHLKTSLFCTY